jgi:uncharacterized membrane protein
MRLIALVHIGSGLAALAFGAIVLLMTKGTRPHKALGYGYIVAMLVLNGTAFGIYRLFHGLGPFHVFALLSLVTLIAGFLPAFSRRPRDRWMYHHFRWMAGSYVGLVAATAAEIAVRLPGIRSPGTGSLFFILVFVSSALVGVVGAFLIARYRRKEFPSVQERYRIAAGD